MNIGDRVSFVVKNRHGLRVPTSIHIVEDIVAPPLGIEGLEPMTYVKVDGHHGYFKESAFVVLDSSCRPTGLQEEAFSGEQP